MFVDSHCHLDKIKRVGKEGLESVISSAKASGVEHMLCVGVTLEDFPAMEKIVGGHSDISMSCGVHPLYMKNSTYDFDQLRTMCQRDDVVAVGETGLDYYYDKEQIEAQKESFAVHIEVANSLNKPLIIHTRDARADTIRMLHEGNADKCRGVLHCFTESREMAEQALDLGFYISISGIVTFNNASELRDVVRYLPLDRILIETDSPWLAPVPHRGKENEPAYVADVGRFVASLKGVSTEQLAAQTKENFYDLFPLAK